MEKAPSTTTSGALLDRLAPLGDIVKIRTVSQFRLISASWKIIGESFLGTCPSKAHKASQEETLRGKGGILKVCSPLIWGRPRLVPPQVRFANEFFTLATS